MKKIEIQIEETLRYGDDIIVLQPDDMTDEAFEDILEKAEQKNRRQNGGAKDLVHVIETMGLKVQSHSSSFPDSPQSVDLDILNVREAK